ncbi:MAG: Cna B-type domain-containing protein [Clostridia bacterium]|nr:Cna B-type domain-containing protein [Clostridia bacterium]
MLARSESPTTKFKNDVAMHAYGWVDHNTNISTQTSVFEGFNYSLATYEAANYGVSLHKRIHGDIKTDNENARLKIPYQAIMSAQSNLRDHIEYMDAVRAGIIPAQTSGVWYDLLPPRVTPLLDTIALRPGDTITNVYTVNNYRNTGRILLVVEAELSPQYIFNSRGYADQPTLNFEAAYTWDDLEEYGSELTNYVVFESAVENLPDGTLGTIKNQLGCPDTPASGNNTQTPDMPADIVSALTNLDPNTDENRFVYGKCTNVVSALTASVSSFSKEVRDDLVNIWTQGIGDQEQVSVYEGNTYTYRLQVDNQLDTASKDIVIYDGLENYVPGSGESATESQLQDKDHVEARKEWNGDWQGKGQWRGTLLQVDLSEFVALGAAPRLLYSQVPGVQFGGQSRKVAIGAEIAAAPEMTGNYDLTDASLWTEVELDETGVWIVPETLSVTAIAIDASRTAEGQAFILRADESVSAYLQMRAPDDHGDETKFSAKGAYARSSEDPTQVDWQAAKNPANNMYAYNNATVRLTSGKAYTASDGVTETFSWTTSALIHNEYTRVGIMPETLAVKKAWVDQNNHDGMRPDSVTVTVMRRLAGSAGDAEPVIRNGEPLTVTLDDSNNWCWEFMQMDTTDENGVRWLYSFREEPVAGYTPKVQYEGVNSYTLLNVHPNEQVEISGTKQWNDDENAAGVRPSMVVITLYRDGEKIAAREVMPDRNGDWTYNFGQMDKYAYGGREYIYTIKEEYVPKYMGEANGYTQVTNTYIPVGSLEVTKTVEHATDVGEDQTFTFTLVLLEEQTDPDAPSAPLLERYPYVIMQESGGQWTEVSSGMVTSGDDVQLGHRQKLVVSDLPSESGYQVIETEAPGFTSTATGAEGVIRAGQTAHADFVNTYAATGAAQLTVSKELRGQAIRKNQFRFELVDNNPGSPDYGKVIRTARVGAPDEETGTTGGSGTEEIVSNAEAIFGQLEYTQADHGQTFHYIIQEVDGGKAGYQADPHTYNVSVSVTDNGDGTMTVTPTILNEKGEDKPGLTFENRYTASGSVTLRAWKALEGRALKEGEFTFELYQYNEKKANKLGTKIATVTNDAEGNIVFPPLEFNQKHISLDEQNAAGYTYVIREKQGSDPTVNYSNEEYLITIKVFDNGDGTLSFTQSGQKATRAYKLCTRCAGNGFTAYSVEWSSGSLTTINGAEVGIIGSQCSNPVRYASFQNLKSKILLCNECQARWAGEGYCSHCKGTGLELGETACSLYAEGYNKMVTDKYVECFWSYPSQSDGYWVHVQESDVSTEPFWRIVNNSMNICPTCYGEKEMLGELTITGSATTPVFSNTVKPGNLSVEKIVPENKGSSNSREVFTFNIELSHAVETLEYETISAVPTPTPTTTPEPTPTPTPKPELSPSPTTAPVVDGSSWYTAQDLTGKAYAMLVGGKLTFFRSSESKDPDGNTFDLGEAKRVQANDRIYYLVDETIKNVNLNQLRPWHNDCASVTAVEMKGDIKPASGAYFFNGMTNLASIDLSKLDTSAMTDMSQMFGSCSSLTSLDLKTFDTHQSEYFSSMFSGCTSLEWLNLSSFDTGKAIGMSSMFANCQTLTSLDLSSFDTSDVRGFNSMFEKCFALTSLDLKTFDTSSGTGMSKMFSECEALTSLNVRTFNTQNVTDMNRMFKYCESLTELELPGFNTQSVTYRDVNETDTGMFEMFRGCSSLKSLDLRAFNTSNVTSMIGMFKTCTALESLDLSSFRTTNVRHMQEMFRGCSSLKSLDLSSFSTTNVQTMTEMFEACESLMTLDLSSFNTVNVVDMQFMFAYCSSLTTLDIRNFDTSKMARSASCFASCPNLSTVTIGNATKFNKDHNNAWPRDPNINNINNRYTGKWVKLDDDAASPLTGVEVFTQGGHAGTWTWETVSYTLNFDANEGAGSMPSKKVTVGDAYSFNPVEFTRYAHELVSFTDGTKTYPVIDDMVTIPANSGYVKDQVVTLVAQWKKVEPTRSEDGRTITVSLEAGESILLKNLPAGTTYKVSEVVPKGWLLLESSGDAGEIVPLETSEAVFTNEYSLQKASVTLKAQKLLDGKAPDPDQEYTFVLKKGSEVLQTVTSIGSEISFKPIVYTALNPARHYYTIIEVVDEEKRDPNINYDDTHYNVEVQLVGTNATTFDYTSVTYKKNDQEVDLPVFNNTTKTGSLQISKSISGETAAAKNQAFTMALSFTDSKYRPWSGELTMGTQTLTVTNGQANVSLQGCQSVTLTGIPAGVHYKAQETGTYPGWTLDENVYTGTIQANVTDTVAFANTYAASGRISLQARKALIGRELEAGEFTFNLHRYDENAADKRGEWISTVTNNANGTILFDLPTYGEEGTWMYVITETESTDPTDPTIVSSKEKVFVTVTAEDKEGKGELDTATYRRQDETTGNAEFRTFINRVKTGELSISKEVLNAPTNAQKEFAFTLTMTDASGKPITGEYSMGEGMLTLDEAGSASLTLEDGETVIVSGLPHGANYSIVEAQAPGFTQSASGAAGNIVMGQTANAVFTNTYSAQGEYTLSASKVLTGRDLVDGEFEFVLTDENGKQLMTAVNNTQGKIAFPALQFTEADVGTKTYTISEKKDGAPGVTYDETVYTVRLTITDNGDGTLTVTDDLNDSIQFHNTYSDKTSISVEKVWQDEDNKLGIRPASITAELYRNAEKVDAVTLNEGCGWKHTFANLLAFDEDGVPYVYDVREVPVVGYVGASATEGSETTITNVVLGVLDVSKSVVNGSQIKDFTFTVALTQVGAPVTGAFTIEKAGERETITANAAGELTFTLKHGETARLIGLPIGVKYSVAEQQEPGYTQSFSGESGTILRGEAHQAAFVNTYAASGSVTFAGTKRMTGRELTAKDVFTFTISEGDKLIAEAKNDAQGKIKYPSIAYTLSDVGSHTYTVKESSESGAGVTVDDREYTVTVEVSDNGDGTLKATPSENSTELNFVNTYEAAGTLTLTARKTVNGESPAHGQVFEFILSDENGETKTVCNELSEIVFPELRYTLNDVGRHVYTVREKNVEQDIFVLDTSVYTVTVDVSDAGDGTLNVYHVITLDGEAVDSIAFDNLYLETLSITKTVQGCVTEETFTITVHVFNTDGSVSHKIFPYTIGDVSGRLISGEPVLLAHGQTMIIDGLIPGMHYEVEEAEDPRFRITMNGLDSNRVEGEVVQGGNHVDIVNRLITTVFQVRKVWRGDEGDGIILTLYANGEKLDPQPNCERSGNVYAYSNLPLYDASGLPIIYSAKETYMDGYLTIYNNIEPYKEATSEIYHGGTIINKAIRSFSVQKVWRGLGDGPKPEIKLTLYCNGEIMNRKTPKPDSEGWYHYHNLPVAVDGKLAKYSVVEEPMAGYVPFYTNHGEPGECAYDGGVITNVVIPDTGDETPLKLLTAMLSLAVAWMLVRKKTRVRSK